MTVCSGFKSNKIRRSKQVKKLEMAASSPSVMERWRRQQPDLDGGQQVHRRSQQLREDKCSSIQQQWSKVHLSIIMLLPASCSQIIKP